jgi:FtsZ-binding cell division protein ZapB
MHLKVQNALSNEALTLEAARELLAQTAVVLKPKADVDLYVPPTDRNTWKRFRTAVSSFFDIVTDEMTTLQSKDELLMTISELKFERDDLDRELEEMKNYQDRFEALE